MAILGTRYNNGMSNVNQNPCNCEPMCTTCGRPWVVCKGECGCKKSCCNNVNFCEYGKKVSGCLRSVEPSCPMQAVIPSVVVEDVTGLKNLADCFVHVTNINTTFYIDDKHRTMVTWAGPVEYDNYDLDANTLGLRSQFLIDHANDYAAYYNKTGAYQKFNFSEGGADEPIRLTMNYSTDSADWESEGFAPVLDRDRSGRTVFNLSCDSSKVSFTNQSTAETVSVSDLVAMLDSGENIVLDNVPLGVTFNETSRLYEFNTTVDGVSLPNKATQAMGDDTSITTYSGSAQVHVFTQRSTAATSLGIFIVKFTNGNIFVTIQGVQMDDLN